MKTSIANGCKDFRVFTLLGMNQFNLGMKQFNLMRYPHISLLTSTVFEYLPLKLLSDYQ